MAADRIKNPFQIVAKITFVFLECEKPIEGCYLKTKREFKEKCLIFAS